MLAVNYTRGNELVLWQWLGVIVCEVLAAWGTAIYLNNNYIYFDRIILENERVTIRRLGRTIQILNWEDVEEVGMVLTLHGNVSKIERWYFYFSPYNLTDGERSRFGSMFYPNSPENVFYFSSHIERKMNTTLPFEILRDIYPFSVLHHQPFAQLVAESDCIVWDKASNSIQHYKTADRNHSVKRLRIKDSLRFITIAAIQAVNVLIIGFERLLF